VGPSSPEGLPPPSFAPPKPVYLTPHQVVILHPTPEIESRGTFGDVENQATQKASNKQIQDHEGTEQCVDSEQNKEANLENSNENLTNHGKLQNCLLIIIIYKYNYNLCKDEEKIEENVNESNLEKSMIEEEQKQTQVEQVEEIVTIENVDKDANQDPNQDDNEVKNENNNEEKIEDEAEDEVENKTEDKEQTDIKRNDLKEPMEVKKNEERPKFAETSQINGSEVNEDVEESIK